MLINRINANRTTLNEDIYKNIFNKRHELNKFAIENNITNIDIHSPLDSLNKSSEKLLVLDIKKGVENLSLGLHSHEGLKDMNAQTIVKKITGIINKGLNGDFVDIMGSKIKL